MLILFIYFQSELLNVSARLGYVYKQHSNLYTVNEFFFRGIRYFNPSRKYLSTWACAEMFPAEGKTSKFTSIFQVYNKYHGQSKRYN